MKKTISIMILFSFVLAPVTVKAEDIEKPLTVILKLQDDLNAVFSKLNADVARAAKKIGMTGIEGEGAREVIRDLAKSTGKYSVDCSAVDAKGIMVIIEPAEYKKYEGLDISKQPQVLRMWSTKQPVMSDVFMSVEGFYAASIEHPVLSGNGDLLGSVSLLFKPEDVFSSVIEPTVKDMPVHTWVMQKDGRDLYDADPAQIGKMLLEDPIYEPFSSIASFVDKVAAARTGSGSYDFYEIGTKNVVSKDAVWTTISVNGTEWRLIVAVKRPSVN